MGFSLGKIVNAIVNPTNAIGTSLLSGASGDDTDAILSGIPFIGPGYAAQQQRRFEGQQATAQMNFQKHMSDTAVRRRMKDLELAGLNPILAAHDGASTPSGAKGTGAAMSGAKDSADMLKNAVNRERDKSSAAIRESKAKAVMAIEQAQQAKHTAKRQSAEEELIKAKLPAAKAEAEYNRKYHEFASPEYDYGSKKAFEVLGTAGTALGTGALFKMFGGGLEKLLKKGKSKGDFKYKEWNRPKDTKKHKFVLPPKKKGFKRRKK